MVGITPLAPVFTGGSDPLAGHRGNVMLRSRMVLSLLVVAATLLPSSLAVASTASSAAPPAGPLSIAQRVAARTAVEQVLWNHRIWPAESGSKPSLAAVMPASAIRLQVEDSLRMTNALRTFAHVSLGAAQLQAEVDREAQASRQPQVLAELWSALGNDPRLIAETIARPIVAERELRAWFSASGRTGSFDAWWRSVRPGLSSTVGDPATVYGLPSMMANET